MNNTLDLLLRLNTQDMKKPQKQVEMKRLSALLGEKVIFTCEAILADKFAEIQEQSIRVHNGHVETLDANEIQVFVVMEGVKEPSFRNKELTEKFNAPTPKELLKKMLLPGEINQLYNIISELSGFGSNVVEEIKN